MPIWPDPAANTAPDAAIGSVIALLSAGLPAGGIALLARANGSGRMIVADTCGDRALVGCDMPVPATLLQGDLAMVDTQGLRLPLAWTLACGGRPAQFAAMPVPGHDLHLVTAWCTPDAALPAIGAHLSAAATVIARLLATGQRTRVQADVSQRLHALVSHLPVPLVFVDSLGQQVLINNRARTLLGLDAGEARHAQIAAALARLINLEVSLDQQQQMASDRTARLSFQIQRGDHAFEVDSQWIDDDSLSGRIWIFADVTQAVTLQARLTRLAGEDALTGVLNRRSFQERIVADIDQADRQGTPLALLTLDLDHFKSINDAFGHQAGDQVLRDICAVVTGTLGNRGVLARIGGEEFAILLPDTAPDAAAAMAERICAAIRHTTLELPHGPLRVTSSIGLALHARHEDTPDTLLARSDRALYAAKHQGRDRVALAPVASRAA
jgi:diguanylate cyclase (GGDEF)-like protein